MLLYMKKKSSIERKKTVTITLGPRTLELLELLHSNYTKRNPSVPIELTVLASAALCEGMMDMLRRDEVKVAADWYRCSQ